MKEDTKQNYSPAANESYRQAMNTAVRILTNRDHSAFELNRKLQQRGYAAKIIDAVIAQCEDFGYIDDRRTARIYIQQLKCRCFGRRYIRLALKKKRLSDPAIERIFLQDYPQDDEYEYADRLLKKKMKTFARETDPQKRSDKIYRFLYSRGFSPAVIRDLVNQSNS
ncbi:MAG: regulatory protein RecX [Desulfobacterales bacterium]